MSQNLQKPKKVKKLSNTFIWIFLAASLLGIGVILFKSPGNSVRYMATFKPFILPSTNEEAIEEPAPDIKEEELINLTQPNLSTPEPVSAP